MLETRGTPGGMLENYAKRPLGSANVLMESELFMFPSLFVKESSRVIMTESDILLTAVFEMFHIDLWIVRNQVHLPFKVQPQCTRLRNGYFANN